jgi:cystathionine beta-lyase/cystathionine gamma-synthase
MDPSFPQYELARKQMKGGCGLVSFSVRADTMQDIETFCESLKHIMMAVSWGGYESLIIPRCASIKPSRFDAHNTEHRMIRFYIGLEDPTYLIADLEQALAKMKP